MSIASKLLEKLGDVDEKVTAENSGITKAKNILIDMESSIKRGLPEQVLQLLPQLEAAIRIIKKRISRNI